MKTTCAIYMVQIGNWEGLCARKVGFITTWCACSNQAMYVVHCSLCLFIRLTCFYESDFSGWSELSLCPVFHMIHGILFSEFFNRFCFMNGYIIHFLTNMYLNVYVHFNKGQFVQQMTGSSTCSVSRSPNVQKKSEGSSLYCLPVPRI